MKRGTSGGDEKTAETSLNGKGLVMAAAKSGQKKKQRNNLQVARRLAKGERSAGRRGAGGAVLLSLLSWPEPNCPSNLKPVMVLVASFIWLALMILATKFWPYSPPLPLLPLGMFFLLAGFVGGSVIAMITALGYSLALHFGLFALDLPTITKDMVSTGYRHKDFIMFIIFAWLYGVPHWRKRFSWIFTLVWGGIVVFSPVIFILISVYGFYGQLPESVVGPLLNRQFLVAWGVTMIAAAALAKILYLIKDALRRALR